MRRKLQIRLDPDTDVLLQEFSEEFGESQSYTLNQIIREYAKVKKEDRDLRAAVAAARGAEELGRINQEILNSMLLGLSSLTETKYQPHKIHPIVEGARKADAQMRLDRMKGKTV